MPRKDAGGGPISAQAQQDLVSEGIENFELPKSIVTKIAKSAVRPLVRVPRMVLRYLADTRQRQTAKGDSVVSGERVDCVHQLSGWVTFRVISCQELMDSVSRNVRSRLFNM